MFFKKKIDKKTDISDENIKPLDFDNSSFDTLKSISAEIVVDNGNTITFTPTQKICGFELDQNEKLWRSTDSVSYTHLSAIPSSEGSTSYVMVAFA